MMGDDESCAAMGGNMDAESMPRLTVPATGGETPQANSVTEQRDAKLVAFVQQCLRSSGIEEGLLGVTSGILLRQIFQLDDAVAEWVKEDTTAGGRIETLAQEASTILPLCRQVDRLASLRNALAARREKSAVSQRR